MHTFAAGQDCWSALSLGTDTNTFFAADNCSKKVWRFDLSTGTPTLVTPHLNGSILPGVTRDSILTLARTEGMLFKFGSGTGSNLSSIRSARWWTRPAR